MSDWETVHLKAKRKAPPPPPSSSGGEDDGSELCPKCNRWSQLVVKEKEGYVVCDSCAAIVDTVLVDWDPSQEFNHRVLSEKVENGEMTRLEASDLCTVLSSKTDAYNRATRCRSATIQHHLNTDKRDSNATRTIRRFCHYHRLSPAVETRALVLWTIRRQNEKAHKSPRRNHMGQIAAVLVYHAALENDCAILFEELADDLMYYESYRLPSDLEDEKEAREWLIKTLKRRYDMQLKDLKLPAVALDQQARSWVHRIMGRLGASPKELTRALGYTLDNLHTYLTATTSDYNPRFVAASVAYLTLSKQMGLRYTLEQVSKASGVLVTNISRHNTGVAEKVQCFKDPLKELEQCQD